MGSAIPIARLAIASIDSKTVGVVAFAFYGDQTLRFFVPERKAPAQPEFIALRDANTPPMPLFLSGGA